MNNILLIILFLLMIYIDRKRGLKLFVSLIINLLVLLLIFYLIALGLNPIICSLIGCLLVSIIILFFVNGSNQKTRVSFISILIVLILLAILIFSMTKMSRIAGFGYESFEEINMFSYDINIDYTNVAISLILISLIGATVDASIAISSSLYEVYENNKKLSIRELFSSGITIGKDILCTTANTLLFAFLGDFMTLLIWFYTANYSLSEIVNSKTFVSELIRIIFSGIGCILVIPITAIITAYTLNKKLLKEEDF